MGLDWQIKYSNLKVDLLININMEFPKAHIELRVDFIEISQD